MAAATLAAAGEGCGADVTVAFAPGVAVVPRGARADATGDGVPRRGARLACKVTVAGAWVGVRVPVPTVGTGYLLGPDAGKVLAVVGAG
jgi:hypothetical protein